MVTVGRGWSCASTCDPARPCYGPGCPNARQAFCPNPYYNPGYGPRPNYNWGPNSYSNPNPPPFWRRWNSAPPRPPPHPPGRQAYPDRSGPDGTVRIGVGNVSSTDIEIDVRDNLVRGGRRRVDIGSGNYAARSNMGVIANNRADADDLMIGADNYSKGGDNKVRVTNNDFRGYGRVRIGTGNYAGGSNRIVVDGLGSNSTDAGSGWGLWGQRSSWWGGNNQPQQGRQQRRRWWLF